jgi:hypothetical protein
MLNLSLCSAEFGDQKFVKLVGRLIINLGKLALLSVFVWDSYMNENRICCKAFEEQRIHLLIINHLFCRHVCVLVLAAYFPTESAWPPTSYIPDPEAGGIYGLNGTSCSWPHLKGQAINKCHALSRLFR